jgi:hypothetical protein
MCLLPKGILHPHSVPKNTTNRLMFSLNHQIQWWDLAHQGCSFRLTHMPDSAHVGVFLSCKLRILELKPL